jgi:steroid 5-alpha reductase family enzyme
MMATMSPLLVVILLAAAVCAFCWIASLISHDNSWVDRLWSIVPVAYVWVFAIATFVPDIRLADPRLICMAGLVTLWGARLTFNFARKGGYNGHEDYRWPVLRARMSPAQFAVFNLLFIVIYQNAILVLITLPALTAYENRSPFGPLDVVLTVVFLGLLAGETVADQQQWNFHRAKAADVAAGREPRPRFLQAGLFRFSRHPNFFFEQAQWWVLFLFGAVAAGSLLQWTVLGAVLLTILFVGSTQFTESITKSKYPEYADYQSRVSAVVPWFPRRARQEAHTSAG